MTDQAVSTSITKKAFDVETQFDSAISHENLEDEIDHTLKSERALFFLGILDRTVDNLLASTLRLGCNPAMRDHPTLVPIPSMVGIRKEDLWLLPCKKSSNRRAMLLSGRTWGPREYPALASAIPT